ncbi:DUF2894 domain-containing protein [Comamonadaceae bacterium G21597-S1]|nr:DUF2894 domain-containing protein [Comamonadaceae bacterium G21597-S1]
MRQPDRPNADSGAQAEHASGCATQAEPSPDPTLDALRASGAQRMDPARFRYLEALERRSALRYGAALQRQLERQLAGAVAAYRARWEADRAELAQYVSVVLQRHPQAAPAVRRLHAESDLRALRRLADRLDAEQQRRDGPLAQLLRRLDGQGASDAPAAGTREARQPDTADASADAAPLTELKTVQRFRDTWERLRVDEQLARSLQQAPDNPGPLNSHLLVLRALRSLQDLSPAYLSRFVAQAEALMWLDGAGPRKAATGKPATRERDRKRGRAGAG